MTQLKYYPKAQIRQGGDRPLRVYHPSRQTRIASDNGHCERRTKNNSEQYVTLRQRKTATEGSQHREHDQLSEARVCPLQFHLALILESAPTAGDSNRRPGLAITQFAGRVMADTIVAKKAGP
jgi:hypothetical protein